MKNLLFKFIFILHFLISASLFGLTTKQESKDIPGWDYLYQKDGITVYQESSNKNYYRAEAVIKENFFTVLAVASDIARRPEWVPNLKESTILQGDVMGGLVLYEVFHLPWPATNRDVVIKCDIKKNYAKKNVLIAFESITREDHPPSKGKIRVPEAKGEMEFSFIDEQTTKGRYQIQLDPGGTLPNFIVNFFIKKAPLDAIKGLIAQIKKTEGQYKEFIDKHKSEADSIKVKEIPVSKP